MDQQEEKDHYTSNAVSNPRPHAFTAAVQGASWFRRH
jgi:hypothetical protein